MEKSILQSYSSDVFAEISSNRSLSLVSFVFFQSLSNALFSASLLEKVVLPFCVIMEASILEDLFTFIKKKILLPRRRNESPNKRKFVWEFKLTINR